MDSQLLNPPSSDQDKEQTQPKTQPEDPVVEQLDMLGTRLRWAAMTLVGTVTEFSFFAHVSERNLRRYIAGVALPGSEVLEALYRTGINVNWLLSGEGCAFSIHAHGRIRAKGTRQTCCGGSEHCPFGLPPLIQSVEAVQ